jgi:hypothetical protein
MWMLLMLDLITQRYRNYLREVTPLIAKRGVAYFEKQRFGIQDEQQEDYLCLLEDLGQLEVFLWLLEWKAYEQNTFFARYDAAGCQVYTWPSMLPEAAMLEACAPKKKPCDPCGEKHSLCKEQFYDRNKRCQPCCPEVNVQKPAKKGGWIARFHCRGIEIRPALEQWGAYPLQRQPDGISYMHVESGTRPCDGNLFIINKYRRP